MSFNFVDDQPEEQLPQNLVQHELIEQLQEPTNEVEFDEAMVEAEKRFAKAQYYSLLLTSFGFDGDDSQTATEIVKEVRGFIRERLAVLLGVKETKTTQPVESVFTAEEVKVLKQIVNKLAKKPELAETKAPSLKPFAPPTKPTVKPVKAPSQAKPVVKPGPKPRKPVAPTEAAPETKMTGDTLEIDGKLYKKAVDNRGEHYVGPDGQKYLIGQNESGQYFLKNVTPEAVSSRRKPIPPLNSVQMSLIAANHAARAQKQDPAAARLLGE
jgi:hypothetical protein